MAELAKTNKVLWLNSIATRAPSLTSGRDIRKIFKKLGSFLAARAISKTTFSSTPPSSLPFPHSRSPPRSSRLILSSRSSLRHKLKMRDFQLWSFIPAPADYAGKLANPSRLLLHRRVVQIHLRHGQKTADGRKHLIEKKKKKKKNKKKIRSRSWIVP